MFKKIESEGYIRKIEKSCEKSEESLKLSKKDLKLAKSLLNDNTDWALILPIILYYRLLEL